MRDATVIIEASDISGSLSRGRETLRFAGQLSGSGWRRRSERGSGVSTTRWAGLATVRAVESEQAIVNAMVEMACDAIVNTQTALPGTVFGSERVLVIGREVGDSAAIGRA